MNNNERRYTPFVPQEDHAGDIIQAQDINELQDAINQNQKELFRQGDHNFLTRCLISLEHRPNANSMIVDLLEDESKLDVSTMENVSYNRDMNAVVFDAPDALEGTFKTKAQINPNGTPYRHLMLLADEMIPEGCEIQYEFSTDDINYYPIQANQSDSLMPVYLSPELYIRVHIRRADVTMQPRLDAWAVLYRDQTYSFRFLDNGLLINVEADWDGTIIE